MQNKAILKNSGAFRKLGILLACVMIFFTQYTLSADRSDRNSTNSDLNPALSANLTEPAQTQTSNSDDQPASALSAEEQLILQKGLFKIYRSNLLKLTYRHIVYPESAIQRHHQGDVLLKVLLHRNGEVKEIFLSERAGYNSLNRAAKTAVKKAAPFPPPPTGLNGELFEILMPIKFRLADNS